MNIIYTCTGDNTHKHRHAVVGYKQLLLPFTSMLVGNGLVLKGDDRLLLGAKKMGGFAFNIETINMGK